MEYEEFEKLVKSINHKGRKLDKEILDRAKEEGISHKEIINILDNKMSKKELVVMSADTLSKRLKQLSLEAKKVKRDIAFR